MTRIAGALLIAFLLAVVAALLYRGNAANARADRDDAVEAQEKAEGERDTLRDTLETERRRADRMTRVAELYEQERDHAQAAADRVAADLRADNLRLRKHWQGCQDGMPPSFPGTPKPDEGADDRAESAGRIVRAAAECDAQVRGLQAVIRADRGLGQ